MSLYCRCSVKDWICTSKRRPKKVVSCSVNRWLQMAQSPNLDLLSRAFITQWNRTCDCTMEQHWWAKAVILGQQGGYEIVCTVLYNQEIAFRAHHCLGVTFNWTVAGMCQHNRTDHVYRRHPDNFSRDLIPHRYTTNTASCCHIPKLVTLRHSRDFLQN